MSTAKKMAVKFLKGWRGYNTGEIAGFEDSVAQRLVKEGVAEDLDTDAAAAKTTSGKTGASPRKPAAKGKGDTQATGGAGDGGGAQQQGIAGENGDPGTAAMDGTGQNAQSPGNNEERP